MLQRYKVAQLDINGCDAVEEDENGDYVEWKDILPVLREARAIAKEIVGPPFQSGSLYQKAKSFLDATKGVEG